MLQRGERRRVGHKLRGYGRRHRRRTPQTSTKKSARHNHHIYPLSHRCGHVGPGISVTILHCNQENPMAKTSNSEIAVIAEVPALARSLETLKLKLPNGLDAPKVNALARQ
jgi:hypothetical protein